MKCKNMFELLNAYVQGTALPEETKQVKAHLTTCPDCQRTLEALKKEASLLKQASKTIKPAFEPSALKALLHDVTIEQRLKTGTEREAQIIPARRRIKYLPYIILATAAGLLIAVTLISISIQPDKSVGEIVSLDGKLWVKGEGAKDWELADAGQELPRGISILTDKDTTAVVQLSDGSKLALQSVTLLTFKGRTDGVRQLVIMKGGEIEADVLKGKGQFVVEVPPVSGRLTVLGTRFNARLIPKKGGEEMIINKLKTGIGIAVVFLSLTVSEGQVKAENKIDKPVIASSGEEVEMNDRSTIIMKKDDPVAISMAGRIKIKPNKLIIQTGEIKDIDTSAIVITLSVRKAWWDSWYEYGRAVIPTKLGGVSFTNPNLETSNRIMKIVLDPRCKEENLFNRERGKISLSNEQMELVNKLQKSFDAATDKFVSRYEAYNKDKRNKKLRKELIASFTTLFERYHTALNSFHDSLAVKQRKQAEGIGIEIGWKDKGFWFFKTRYYNMDARGFPLKDVLERAREIVREKEKGFDITADDELFDKEVNLEIKDVRLKVFINKLAESIGAEVKKESKLKYHLSKKAK